MLRIHRDPPLDDVVIGLINAAEKIVNGTLVRDGH